MPEGNIGSYLFIPSILCSLDSTRIWGGDVKLILAVIPLVPLYRLVSLFLSISIAGMFVALCCMAVPLLGRWSNKPTSSLREVSALCMKSPISVPYGVAIAVGVLVETFRDQGM